MPEVKRKFTYYLKQLIPYILRDKWLFLFGIFAMLVTSSLRLIDPLLIAHIIDKSVPSANIVEMIRYGIYFVVVIAITGVLNYLQVVLLSKLGIKIITRFKFDIFRHLLKLPVAWFNGQPVGELIARVESDSERVRGLFSHLSITIIGNLVFFAGVVTILLIRESTVTVYLVPIIVVVVIAYYYLIRYISKFYRKIREMNADITAKITDYVQGMPVIQTLNRQENIVERLRESSEKKKRFEIRTSFIEYSSSSSFLFVFNVGVVALIIVVTSPKIIGGLVSIGTLFVFIQYISRVIWPLLQISENVMQMQRAFASLARILELTENKTEDELYLGRALPYFEENIVFDHVWFAYKDEEWVLKDISFTIPKGKRIALVGASGSGKTTTISLLCAFYPVTRGRILVDGIPLTEINLRLWREKIGLILQDIFLFPGNITENIRVYNDEISVDKVRQAVGMVRLDEFIVKQELGLETELAERGQNISQGEKQLISFARALAFEPEVIIMDEATASIDPQTEAKIQRSLNEVLSGKTAVIVAHRLTSVIDADQILLFRDGEIIDRGTHCKLLGRSAEYKRFVELQLMPAENADE